MSLKLLVTSLLRHPLNSTLNGSSLLTTSLMRYPYLETTPGGAVTGVLEYANFASFPAVGTLFEIYHAADTDKYYYWDGTQYIEVLMTASGIKEVFSFAGAGPKIIIWTSSRIYFFGAYGNFEVYLMDGALLMQRESIPCEVTLTGGLPSSYSFDNSGIAGKIIIT